MLGLGKLGNVPHLPRAALEEDSEYVEDKTRDVFIHRPAAFRPQCSEQA